MTSKTNAATLTRDPVCGMELQITEKTISLTLNGRTYYFDNNDCAMKFQANPDAYVNPPEII